MTELLQLRASDRVLVLAPHPDDESIACGGLLQVAQAAGAARRVIVVTDGDNNPWPQRWIEKRWRIDADARARWGARRRAEAQAALNLLGVDAGERFFLGLPDLGLTPSLLRDPDGLPQQLQQHIDQFRPSHIALPSLEDRHPDHSAVHIAARLALLRTATPMQKLLIYAVHGEVVAPHSQLELSTAQRNAKQAAILQHDTQMRLSRKRFVGFAANVERFRQATNREPARADHPLHAQCAGAMLNLSLSTPLLQEARSGLHVLLLIDFADTTRVRWRLPLASGATPVQVRDLCADRVLSSVQWRTRGDTQTTTLALGDRPAAQLAFAKLASDRARLVVFDRYGWQSVRIEPDVKKESEN